MVEEVITQGVAMSKKIQLILVTALTALTSSVFAQTSTLIDVIYRDFPVTADGFEEFMGCDDDGNSNSTRVSFDENDVYNIDGTGTPLRYDKCLNGLDAGKRGYRNGPDRLTCDGWENWNSDKQGNYVKVTKGMVGNKLQYNKNCPDELKVEDPDGKNREFVVYRYCASPTAGNSNCSSKKNPGNKISQWFSSGGDAKELWETIELKRKNNNEPFVIEHNANIDTAWNNNGKDNGFFPLDKYDPDGTGDASGKTWGRQSLNYWCPPNYKNDDIDKNSNYACSVWYSNSTLLEDGPKNPNAARNAAKSKGMNKLHNYGFSAAGSGAFKYSESANDVFEFTGDDDMWIFIDGELVPNADLGGIHLAAPAMINIQTYGKSKGWTNGETHVVNFFYMDRNTDGSNFKLKMSLTDLAPSRFGAPRILKAETTQDPDGTSSTLIYVSSKLNEASITKFLGTGYFPIIVYKKSTSNIYGYKLEYFNDEKQNTADGYVYSIKGQVCDKDKCGGNLIIGSGDSLSFNVKAGDLEGYNGIFDGLALPDETWYIENTTGVKATKVSFGPNKTNLPPIVFKPEVVDNDVRKPDFNVDIWFTGDPNSGNGSGEIPGGVGALDKVGGNGLFPNITKIWDSKTGTLVDLPNGKDNTTVHGFGVKGTPIPPNRAGELIITAYPNSGTDVKTASGTYSYAEWSKATSEEIPGKKFFGMPPKAKSPSEPYGVADPTAQQPSGGYMFVKNGFPNESSVGGVQVAPTRCISDKDEKDGNEAPRVNCLNFSLEAKTPFQIAVTVYDQLGNFVTQYRETVNEQEFRSVVQGPTFVEPIPAEGTPGYVYGFDNGDNERCVYPTSENDFGKPDIITTNGLVKVNVNIYPFSKDGRRFGNGVYILKIDRVDLPYSGCMNAAGTALKIDEQFVRYHADTKFGWMRTK